MKKTLFFLLIILIYQGGIFAQGSTALVRGTVTDNSGMPIPGVNVIEKGTDNGTVTNFDGQFSIDVPTDAYLQFSFIGYATVEFPVDGRANLDVEMAPDASALNEIVVVGYGTQKKSDLTGSVSSVSTDELNQYPAIDATQALQGRAPGVSVTSSNGEPGAAARIRIRGGTSINASSDPLYVVDGFAGATPPQPGDIASIEVLKDASATAIYGSRGANGVVLVTTKRGSSGKTQIELNTSYSFQEVGNRLDMLNGEQFAEYINEVYQNDGSSNIPFENPSSYGQGTDWQNEIFRSGKLQNYQLSASGGMENMRFYTSLNYFGQEGVVINSEYERISGLLNLSFDINENIRAGAKMLVTRTERDGIRTQESSGGTADAGVIGAALKFEPTQGIFDENGNYTISQIGDPHDNPIAVARERENNTINDLFQGNSFVEIDLLNDFQFRTSLGVQINNSRNGNYVPTTLVAGRNTGGSGSIASGKYTNAITENYLTYSKEFNEIHSFNLMGGYSYQAYRAESWTASNRQFISDGFSFWNLGGGSNFQSPSSALNEWALSSFYGRINYSLMDRYLLTFTGRNDGSSRFGANNKWAFFPSGAFAWNIGRESFMENWDDLSQFKIRTSYGVTGNTEIGSYQSLARFSPTLAVIGGNQVNAVRPTAVANQNLSWESTQQTNIGLDIGFWNNRLNFTADYYYKLTEDLLYSVPLPQYSGYSSSLQNVGSLENKGWEFALNTINWDGDFSWRTDFNISFNRNEIISLPGGEIRYSNVPAHLLGPESQLLREGEVVGAFYGRIFDGIYQEGDDFSAEPDKVPGDVKFVDINNDGTVNGEDRTIIGNPHPDFVYGFNNDFAYKNFDLTVFIQGSEGNDMMNFTRMELDWMAGKSNATTDALNRWTPNNTSTDIPRASGSHSPQVSTRFVEDGSYVRLKNIVLGYNLPESTSEMLKINNLRLYVSAQNVFTITDYTGYDPEVSYQDSNRNIGLDYASYPNIKSITCGLDISF
ncbi:TonB-dependent receptor [Salegentibacter sp. BDJ18]|uniref:SusC/RagA family TonB-linked outer membrane protein n=1 Tax=Salegentibacter sp. BDJ18 TaxID=2816376 RepID=UPI001AAE64D1|nr:TonB-dependent receptor [Salegentibacter sp. BDJ18]MBO2543180.1 TonB-dependent receptor [Salegentibacter sp. BDJ18]